jgi:hypothetical protein
MPPKAPSPKTEFMDVETPMPFLRTGVPADQFRALRQKVKAEAGFDFMSKCSDMMRSKGFKSNKPGVAKKSRHQCGDAFDYNIESPRTVVVQEDAADHTQFRTYLKCAAQDGTMGVLKTVTDYRGNKVKAHLYDFTEAAGSLGWHRIPAHKGWKKTGKNFSKMEYWHYQNTEGKSWESAMKFLYP